VSIGKADSSKPASRIAARKTTIWGKEKGVGR